MFDNRLLFAGRFPAEWWMRDFADKVFAIIGRYSEPLTLREANLLIGNQWRMLEVRATRFREESSEGYDERITRIETITTEDPIGSLCFGFEKSNRYFHLKWIPQGARGQGYNLTQCCIPTDRLVVHPRGGLHHAAHVTPTYDTVSISAR